MIFLSLAMHACNLVTTSSHTFASTLCAQLNNKELKNHKHTHTHTITLKDDEAEKEVLLSELTRSAKSTSTPPEPVWSVSEVTGACNQ